MVHRYTVLQLSRREFALRSSALFNCCAEGRCRSPVGLSRATQHEAGRGARAKASLLAPWCLIASSAAGAARHTDRNAGRARRPQRRRHRAAHTSAPQDRRRGAKPREQSRGQPHDRPVTPLNDMHSRGAWPALSRFCEGENPYPAFLLWGVTGVSTRQGGHCAIYRRTGGRKKTGLPGPMSRPMDPRMRGFRCALLQRYVPQGAAARAQAP